MTIKIRKYSIFWVLLLITHYSLLFSAKLKVTSKQIEFCRKDNKIIFRENVKVTDNKNVLFADTAIKDEIRKTVELSGNIHGYYITDTTETMKFTTERGMWDAQSNQIILWLNPYIVYTTTAGENVEIKSDKIIFDNNYKVTEFTNNVNLMYKNISAKTEKAKYLHQEKKFVLLTISNILPTVDYSNDYTAKFTAETITLFPEERKLKFENNFHSITH